MNQLSIWTLGSVVVIFGGSLLGIFATKTRGFGRYTSSVTILTLSLFVASLAFLTGTIEWQPLSNLLFAAIGFAGGLTTVKDTRGE